MNGIKEVEMRFPIDLLSRGGMYYIVSAILPKQHFSDPFMLDSLQYRFGIAEVSKDAPDEQNVLVRPLHYDENDSRIELTLLDDFIHTFTERDLLEDRLRFIFHMSRCGSTLTTQMLATSERFFVVSEPPVITKLLDPALTLTADYTKEELLRAIICAIESCRPKNTEFTFIKFRSWNTLFLDEFIKQFPKTKWMFVHRNGLEVLESVLRDPPGWLRSRATYAKYFSGFLGVEKNTLLMMSIDEYVARMLGALCREVNTLSSKDTFLLDYKDLKNLFFNNIAKIWGITLTDREIQLMDNASQLYSKDTAKTKLFEPDSEIKRAKTTKVQEEFIYRFV